MNTTEASSLGCNGTCLTTYDDFPVHSIYDDVLEGLKYVDMVLLPTCLLLGVCGNLITLIVMNLKYFRNMTSRYFLVALSISDNLLLLSQPFNKELVIDLLGRDYRAISNFGCKAYFWFFKNGKMTSSWFVVLLCLERFVAVQFPFRVKAIFCKRNCLIAIASVYIINGVYNGVWSFAPNILEDGRCYPDGIDRNDPETAALFRDMLLGGVSIYSIIPIIIMLIVTPMIIFSLVQYSRKRKQMTGNSKFGKDLEVARVSTMLLSIVITYIILVVPVTVLHIGSFFLGVKSFGHSSKPFLVYRTVAQMLEQLNYTINFFLYVVSNRKFRESVVTLFKDASACCIGRALHRLRNSFSSSSEKPQRRIRNERAGLSSLSTEKTDLSESQREPDKKQEIAS